MNIEEEVQKKSYFEYRNVDAPIEDNFILPCWIKNEIQSKDSFVLDYGCGFGQNLSALKREGYDKVFGLDIEVNAINFCEKAGLNVSILDSTDLRNPFNFKFDIIILTHVLEHVKRDEIISTLYFIRNKLLKVDGKLLIAVPNAQSNTDCYWMYEDWTHTTLFTSGSLYYVLKASGFNSIDFLDIDCTLDIKGELKKTIRKIFLKIYILNKRFWNKITSSSYHKPSPDIYSYEIKCKAG